MNLELLAAIENQSLMNLALYTMVLKAGGTITLTKEDLDYPANTVGGVSLEVDRETGAVTLATVPRETMDAVYESIGKVKS